MNTIAEKKILIFIPCYNCMDQVPRVISKLSQDVFELADVLVVDNSSTDNTLPSILKARGENPFKEQIYIKQNSENYGLGGSFKNAFSFARTNGYKHFAILHGDDQAEVRDLLKIIKMTQIETETSAFFGARFHQKSEQINYSKMRNFANRFFNSLVTVLTGEKIDEIGSGLNVFYIPSFPEGFINKLPDHIAFDLQILLYTVDNKLNYKFVPITWKSVDEKSTINDLSTALVILKELFLWKLRLKQDSIVSQNRTWVDIVE